MKAEDLEYLKEVLNYGLNDCVDKHDNAETHFNKFANALDALERISCLEENTNSEVHESLKRLNLVFPTTEEDFERIDNEVQSENETLPAALRSHENYEKLSSRMYRGDLSNANPERSEYQKNWANAARGGDVGPSHIKTPLNKMNWIDVNDKHFAELTEKHDGYSWESDMIDEPFMVAVKTSKGWCMQQVVLNDQIGLQCWTEEEGTTYFGWGIEHVSHWFKLVPPKQIKL